MSTKHTPGPWQLVGPDDFGDYIVNTDGDPTAIAAIVNGNWLAMGGLTEQHKANAALIAAAPELLEALKALRFAVFVQSAFEARESARQSLKDLVNYADAVIAKAEGQS